MELSAVLFDFAGTLLMPADERAWVAVAAASIGLELSGDELGVLAAAYAAAGMPGGPYPEVIPEPLATLYAERDLSGESHHAAYTGLMGQVGAEYGALTQAVYDVSMDPEIWVPYADAEDAVGALLQAGVRVGVISNAGFDPRPMLRRHGFGVLAETTTVSFEHGVMKPDPALFRIALRTIGAQPGETLMVGDNPEADAGAARLGIKTLLLPMSPPGAVHGLAAVPRMVLGT